MKNLVVLSGAGISAESGLSTFRDSDGLWEQYNVMDVASIEGWYRNKELVMNFYNERRRQLKDVEPNAAHKFFAEMEAFYNVMVITQNVDNLHERGGSSKVVHLHGELTKVKSSVDEKLVYEIGYKDVSIGDKCEKGSQLRPAIVWFGEAVPMIETAMDIVRKADILVVIGTSLNVYPAASLVYYKNSECSLYLIDPNADSINYQRGNLTVIKEKATVGVERLRELLEFK